jgi:hypothetical protein
MNQDKVKNKKLNGEHGGGTELQFRNAVPLVTFVIPIAMYFFTIHVTVCKFDFMNYYYDKSGKKGLK